MVRVLESLRPKTRICMIYIFEFHATQSQIRYVFDESVTMTMSVITYLSLKSTSIHF